MRRLREKLAQANLKLGRNYPEPKLSYTQRGTSAGTAWLESYEIRLNPVLLLENSEAFIEEVVPHELAHLLVWKHFGRVEPGDARLPGRTEGRSADRGGIKPRRVPKSGGSHRRR